MEAETLLESSVNSYQIFVPLSFHKRSVLHSHMGSTSNLAHIILVQQNSSESLLQKW